MKIDITLPPIVNDTPRVRQLQAMFDTPSYAGKSSRIVGTLDFPETWNVGLITGPSGAGKSTLAKQIWGTVAYPEWSKDRGVIEDFFVSSHPDDPGPSMSDVTEALGSVGFNTIPAWMRPFHALSTGEQFRASIARELLLSPHQARQDWPIVVDEFTSVVDRQVARITSDAVQRYIRARDQRFVAVTVHEDVIPWLNPDWVIRMPELSLERRHLQRRPGINLVFSRVSHAAWPRFAPYHYLSADLNKAATCFGCWAWVEGEAEETAQLAGFVAVLFRPHKYVRDIYGISRQVTLPDWQGAGIGRFMYNTVGALYSGLGFNLHHYPAHPALIRALDRSSLWRMQKRPGSFSGKQGYNASVSGKFGGRPNGVYRYVGPAMDCATAQQIIDRDKEVRHVRR